MGTRLRDLGPGCMSKPAKSAIVRYYVDADVLGLAKILVQIRSDVTYPADPGGPVKGGRVRAPCTINDTGTEDTLWIPPPAAVTGRQDAAAAAFPGDTCQVPRWRPND
jgi:hypothetical protein